MKYRCARGRAGIGDLSAAHSVADCYLLIYIIGKTVNFQLCRLAASPPWRLGSFQAVQRARIDCAASVLGNARVDAQISSQLKLGRYPTTPKLMEQPQQLAHSLRIGASREDCMLLLQLEGQIFLSYACLHQHLACSDSCPFF